jgi:hypothetical protein
MIQPASLLARHVSRQIRSSIAPSIQTLLKPTVCLPLMRRCTRRSSALEHAALRCFVTGNVSTGDRWALAYRRGSSDIEVLESVDHRFEARFKFPHFVAHRDIIDPQIFTLEFVGRLTQGPPQEINGIRVAHGDSPNFAKAEFILLQLLCGGRTREQRRWNKRFAPFGDQIAQGRSGCRLRR